MSALHSTQLAIGDKFDNFEDVKENLELYERSTFTKYWRRDSRTIETAKKRVCRPLLDRLKYYEVSEGKQATM